MSFPLAPPPPGFTRAGPLAAVADAFACHVGAEERRSWVAASSSLVVTPDGRLGARHFPAARLEEEGLRSLLVYYNDCFPRATPVLSKLSAPTFAAVWSELFAADDVRQVRVFERGPPGARQVFAVTSPSYPHDYDVSRLVLDVAGLFGGAPVPCSLAYDAGPAEVTLLLHFAEFDVRVWATDRDDDKGTLRVSVVSKAGADLGDPLPELRKRKRGSNDGRAGATVLEGIAAKIREAPKFYAVQQQQSRRSA